MGPRDLPHPQDLLHEQECGERRTAALEPGALHEI